MKELITKEQAIAIRESNGQPTMSSLRIAEVTGKRHPDVVRDIKSVLSECEIDVSKFAHTYLVRLRATYLHLLKALLNTLIKDIMMY